MTDPSRGEDDPLPGAEALGGELPGGVTDRLAEGDELVGHVVLPPTVPQVAGGRSEARERAVHLLYESRMKARPGPDTVADQLCDMLESRNALVGETGEVPAIDAAVLADLTRIRDSRMVA